MTDRVDIPPETTGERPAGEAVRQFGLTAAIALIMGSIIGVGIFNLPTSLASYGPITPGRRWRSTTVGALALALLFAALSRRLPADGGPYAYARVGVRQPRSASPTRGPTGSPPGPATPRSPSAGCSTSRSSSTRTTTGAAPIAARPGRPVDPGRDQPVRRQEHGRGPGRDHGPQVRRAGVHVHGRPVLHQRAPTSRRGTSAARARSARSAAAWRSPCSATSASRPPRSPRPRCATPTATSRGPPSSAPSPLRSSTCSRSSRCSASCPTDEAGRAPRAPFSDAVNAMFGGTWAGNVMAIAVIISGFGALNGWTMICAEMPLAAAKDGLFPRAFKRLSAQRRAGVRHHRLDRPRLGRDDHQLPRLQRRDGVHHPGADDRHHRGHPVRLLGAGPDQVAAGRPPARCRRRGSSATWPSPSLSLVFSILFIWYSRNTGNSFWVYWAPFLLAGGALLLGIPVYLAQRSRLTPAPAVPPYR